MRSLRSLAVAGAVFGFGGVLGPSTVAFARGLAAANDPAASETSDALLVFIELDATKLEPEAIRQAIEAELGVKVRSREERPREGLSVDVKWRRASVSFRTAEGEETSRSLDLPSDPGRAVEIIALLAGNLARDQAGELIDRLTPEPAPAAEESTPEAAPPPPVAPERPAESTPPAAVPKPAPSPPPARDDGLLRSPGLAWNLSFFHPITLFPNSERRELDLELGFAVSRVGALTGVGFTFGYLRIDRHVDGVAAALGWTRAGGTLRGVQLGALVNEGHGTLRGADISTLVSYRSGLVEGAEVSGVVAIAGDVRGAQLGGFLAQADRVRGAELAGALAIAGEVDGVQLGPVALSGDVRGAQGSVIGVARDVTVMQLGVVEVARDVGGAQLGVVEVARDVGGAQAGVVNVARRAPLQIGLVNVAERVDLAAIGAVNIAGNGSIHPLAYAIGGSRLSYNAGVKFVAGYAYSLLAVGSNGTETGADLRTEAGAGFYIEPEFWRDTPALDAFSMELGVHGAQLHVASSEAASVAENTLHYRAGLGLRFVRLVRLLGGYDVSHDVAPFGEAVAHGPWAGVAIF